MTRPDVSIPDDLHLFTEDWEAVPAVPASPATRYGCALVLLSDEGQQAEVRRRLTADQPGLTIVWAVPGAGFRRLAADRYELGGDLTGAYRALLAAVAAEHGQVDVIAHLWGTEAGAGRALLTDPDPLRALLRVLASDGVREGRVPARIVFGGTFTDDRERAAVESWLGFERSIGLVVPGTALSVLCLDGGTAPATELPEALARELQAAHPASALYTGGRRHEQRVRPVDQPPPPGAQEPLRTGGTYLITGGTGGLGTIFATWLAERYQARLVLLGRRPQDDPRVAERLAALAAAGAVDTLYRQADVADATALTAAVTEAVARFGRLDGVLHAAGVERHGNIADRDAATFAAVLAPKVAGTRNLEDALEATGVVPDFVCYFSSSAAVLGDFGSCDYAVGNRYQSSHARLLARHRPGGPRRLAVNWPLWRSDGMNLADADSGDFYLRSSGQRYLEPTEGTAVLRELLTRPDAGYLVMAGQRDRIRTILRVPAEPAEPAEPVAAAPTGADPADALRRELGEAVSQILRIPADRLAPDENLRDFGFDSITLVEFAGVLAERLGVSVTPDLFFSYPSLGSLHAFLLERHQATLAERYAPAPTQTSAPAPVEPPAPAEPAGERRGARLRTRRGDGSRFAAQGTPQPRAAAPVAAPTPAATLPVAPAVPAPAGPPPAAVLPRPGRPAPGLAGPAAEQVSIIGMSGRFPAARSVDELWTLLAEGRGALGPMPRERHAWWADGKPRTMGALPGVAEFDPLFFEIAPSEAAALDPRQRLLLEEMWHALEDAGHGAERLAAQKVGVFVGIEDGDYRLLTATGDATEENITANHNAVLAARLSYFLNLTGPSVALNTACSSGLVALHDACLSLRNGDCDTAIVASANVHATPREYDTMTGAGMLSPTGACRAFDRKADGMVPGEAVAVVVLRRRDLAERDGDRVHANILATGVNNDGRTNGITAPNGQAQARLLGDVYRRAGISPDSLGHLVTHGTGTRLGDPVEINALAEAFRPHTERRAFCALTSTKPNVGHAQAASGLVSLISLVLGMRHETIPPSIECDEVSDFVDWANSPFYVNQRARAWPADGAAPRRGAVSAFGISGTNAHAVVEAHGTVAGELAALAAQPAAGPHLLLLSARTETALGNQLRLLADHLESLPAQVGDGVLASVSHALITGRHHFARRRALVVRDRADAVAALRRAADGAAGPETVAGTVPRDHVTSAAATRAFETLVAEVAADGGATALTELGRAYCQGHAPGPLRALWGGTPPLPVDLPPYPFDHAEYWLTEAGTGAGAGGGTPAAGRAHPLVHRNVSDVTGTRYASTLTGREEWFEPAAGGRLLPGALLELARAAVVLGLGGEPVPVALKEVAWYEPASAAGGPLDLRIDLRAAADGTADWAVDWAVYVVPAADEPYLVCDGAAGPVPADALPALDLAALRGYPGPGRLLLELPAGDAESTEPGLVLRPAALTGLLDTVWQRLGAGEAAGRGWRLPAAEFAVPGEPARWALVTPGTAAAGGDQPVTVELAAADGTVLARLTELAPEAAPLAAPDAAAPGGDGEGRQPRMRGWTVAQCVAWEVADAAGRVLGIPAEELDADENLANYGIDSLNIAKFAAELSGRLGFTITPDVFFSHPTLTRLSHHLLTAHTERMNERYREGGVADPSAARAAVRERLHASARFAAPARPAVADRPDPLDEPVAIVGLSGRFPDARGVEELWSILAEGRSVVGDVPEERQPWWQLPESVAERAAPRFGSVPGIAEFDPLFFEISPREAELMDPRQRLLLQEMWRALEDAGHGSRPGTGENIGIFVGVEEGDYRYLVDEEATVTSNATSILASRLAYFLNLHGPSMAINTSCSSGLVALHEACLSLRYGDCDTAIVAGASLMSSAHDYLVMDKANMLSADGTCYAFDERANGMVPGEAVAVLVLKKLHAAERDGNPVYATILGSGVNYDGRTNGITAPSGEAQARLLTSVYDRHRIAPDSLDYLVAHGTGTRLGDPIETNALADAFRSRTDRTGYCALTSIKPNIGHSMAASGLVNLIALVTSMRKGTIPPSINCEHLSDYIDWENSPFFVNREARAWPETPGRPRRGAVSSFGMSGTNAHVVIQAHDAGHGAIGGAAPAAPGHHLLLLSAKTEEALHERLTDLADDLAARPAEETGAGFLASVSRTLMTGRHHFTHRCAVVVQDRDDAVRLLREAADGAKIPNLVRGVVSRDFAPNSTIERLINGLVLASQSVWHDPVRYSDHLTALAEFYSQGYPPQFDGLWEKRPSMVSLPGYPFATEQYWAPAAPGRALAVNAAGASLQPVVRERTPDGNVIHRYSSQFTGREAFLNDLLIPIENTTR